jgi:hypothetical protein
MSLVPATVYRAHGIAPEQLQHVLSVRLSLSLFLPQSLCHTHTLSLSLFLLV